MNIPTDYVLFINILIFLIYAAMIYVGYKKGFIFALVSIIYNALAIFVSWLLAPVLAGEFPMLSADIISENIGIVGKLFDLDPIVNTVVYFVIIFIILRIVYLFITLFAKSVNAVPLFGSLNKIIGALIGVVNATIVVTILSLLLVLPVFSNGKQIRDMTMFKYIEKYSDMAIEYGIEHVDVSTFKDYWSQFDSDAVREEIKEWIDNNKHE